MKLITRIERYLRRSRTPATKFGIEAARDPGLVKDLWNGRQPRPTLKRRIEAYLDSAEARLARKK